MITWLSIWHHHHQGENIMYPNVLLLTKYYYSHQPKLYFECNALSWISHQCKWCFWCVMSGQLTTGLSGMIMFNTKLTSQCNSVVVRHNWAESFHETHELFFRRSHANRLPRAWVAILLDRYISQCFTLLHQLCLHVEVSSIPVSELGGITRRIYWLFVQGLQLICDSSSSGQTSAE